MMKTILFVILSAVLWLPPSPAAAQIVLAAQHRIIAQQEDYNGDIQVTIEFTIFNNSSLDMAMVELQSVTPYFSRFEPLVIDTLKARSMEVVNWVATTPYSPDELSRRLLLTLTTSVVDGEGRRYEMDVVSQAMD